MDEMVLWITGGSEIFTPEMVAKLMSLLMCLECISGIIKSMLSGVK